MPLSSVRWRMLKKFRCLSSPNPSSTLRAVPPPAGGRLLAAGFREMAGAQKIPVLEQPELKQHHQVCPARERAPHARLARQQFERAAQTSRHAQLVIRQVGSHKNMSVRMLFNFLAGAHDGV